jgi:hypothetical protein
MKSNGRSGHASRFVCQRPGVFAENEFTYLTQHMGHATFQPDYSDWQVDVSRCRRFLSTDVTLRFARSIVFTRR